MGGKWKFRHLTYTFYSESTLERWCQGLIKFPRGQKRVVKIPIGKARKFMNSRTYRIGGKVVRTLPMRSKGKEC